MERAGDPARPPPGRRDLEHLLLRQLALHRGRAVLLRPLHQPTAPQPSVVARDRGAVLPGVAARRPRPAQARPRLPPVPDRGDDPRDPVLAAGDGDALHRRQPVAGLLRHRGARPHDPRRLPPRARVARRPRSAGTRRRRAAGVRWPHARRGGLRPRPRARERALFPRREPALRVRRRRPHQRGDRAEGSPATGALAPAAALRRPDLLRPLPLALADHRVRDRGPHRPRGEPAQRAPDRDHLRDHDRLVPSDRAAHPPAPAPHGPHAGAAADRAERRARQRPGRDRRCELTDPGARPDHGHRGSLWSGPRLRDRPRHHAAPRAGWSADPAFTHPAAHRGLRRFARRARS